MGVRGPHQVLADTFTLFQSGGGGHHAYRVGFPHHVLKGTSAPSHIVSCFCSIFKYCVEADDLTNHNYRVSS